jgi:hypothetical protein
MRISFVFHTTAHFIHACYAGNAPNPADDHPLVSIAAAGSMKRAFMMICVSRIELTVVFQKPILTTAASNASRRSDSGPVSLNKITAYSLTVTGENHDFEHRRLN